MRVPCLMAAMAAVTPSLDAQDTTGSRTLVPLPAIFYQPETGLAFGAAIGWFTTPPPGPDGRPSLTSSTLAVAIFTTKAQLVTSLGRETWPDDGRRHVQVGVEFQRFPTKYWSIGNDTPDSVEVSYTPVFAGARFELTTRVAEHLYVGGALRGRWRRLRDSVAAPGTATGILAGGGPMVTWDSRDRVNAPRHGALFQFRSDAYPDTPGPTGAFGVMLLDLRGYITLTGQQVLALQVVGKDAWGDPPFDQYPTLGGDAVLRGFYDGRYRDRRLLALQAEYRGTVIGRFGIAAAVSTGQVMARWDDLAFDAFHTSVGGGLRFVLDPAAGLAIRVDWATATDGSTTGLYFSAGEAF